MNRGDAQSRRIYGSIFGGLLVYIIHLSQWLLSENGDIPYVRFFRTLECYLVILVVCAASFHSLYVYRNKQKAGMLVTGIVGLLAAFGILWYFSGVFASLWT